MRQDIPFREAFRYWLKLGFISFGGPAGQIAMMHKDIVEKKKWVSDNHFLQALNFCMLLPGPEAQQLAVYIGWLMHRTWGGIVAGTLFVLPSVFILWGLSWMYASFGNIPAVSALFYGLKPAVVAIVAEAVIRIGRKSIKNEALAALAASAFIGIYILDVPFPVIVFAAGTIGYLGGVYSPKWFVVLKPRQAPEGQDAQGGYPAADAGRPRWPRAFKVTGVCLTMWALPVAVLGAWFGWDSIFVDIGVLFSKAAVVTFGGAYAVLSYVGQQAVEHYGWIRQEQMMDGLALAETTPGPLIMVNQFVGYVAAYNNTCGLTPGVAGAVGGLLTTWVTFLPSFLFVLLLAPYIERLRGNARLGAALSAITAAVVGVVLNLGVNFTRHAVVSDAGGLDLFAVAAAAAAFLGMQFLKWPMLPVIAGSACAGYLWKAVLLM